MIIRGNCVNLAISAPKFFSTVKIFLNFFITFMRVVRSGVYHIHFGPVRPGLVFFSDLQKSWGGECDGTHNCTCCTPGPCPQSLVYTYVVIVTCARWRSCNVITCKWRERLGLECCARPHVFNCGLELAVRCNVVIYMYTPMKACRNK